MTLQAISTGFWFPVPIKGSNSAIGFDSSVTIDSSADRIALVFRSPFTDSIDQIAVSFGTVGTSAPLDYRVETVGTGADAPPSGTLWAANTFASAVTPLTNSVVAGTLTANASITRGNMVAIVIQENGATAVSLTINRWDSTGGDTPFFGSVPYGSFNLTGTYANSALVPIIAVHLATANQWAYLGPIPVPNSATNTTISTSTGGTTGTSRGIRFTLPFPARLSAVWGKFSVTTGADFNVELYDSGGTLLATLVSGYDASQQRAAGGNTYWLLPCDATYDLAANTVYRLVITATTANNFSMGEFTFNNSDYLNTYAGTSVYTTAFIGGAWLDNNTKCPLIGMMLTAFDDATGGSGGGANLLGNGTLVSG